MATADPTTAAPADRYRWTALSNTTLGVFMAALDSSIVLISLPAIFRGIHLDPLEPGNVSYLLWMLMGYLVVTAVLVVTFGRLGDMYGRVKMYNAGFAVFTVASILLSLTPFTGSKGALWLIGFRIVQGVGGALLLANSTAIITDAFPAAQRGMAIGINMVAAIAGQFVGLVVGGLLADIDWRLIFWVNVPVGIFGTVWAYLKLREVGVKRKARMDWWGNITFAVGLILVLVGITYGIQPYGGHSMGWTSPVVLAELISGVILLAVFAFIETRVTDPMFNLALFRIRAFAAGNAANFLISIGRGGLQFMLIIWLQGIWLPLHGYNFVDTPLWAGIYMLPLTLGFLVAGPISGWLSDRYGARLFSTVGAVLVAVSFALLMMLPADFSFPIFGSLLLLNGIGVGLFAAPNTTAIMNSVPATERGAASGMRATFQNSAQVLSIGLFFSLMVVGLASTLPAAMSAGLHANGVSLATASKLGHLPPVGLLFAAFLGYNPIQKLLGPQTLATLSHHQVQTLTGKEFFPHLISGPFIDAMGIVFIAALVMSMVAAIASMSRGSIHIHVDEHDEETGADAAPTDDDVGAFGAPLGDGIDALDAAPMPEEWSPA
jgi:MFS family permease